MAKAKTLHENTKEELENKAQEIRQSIFNMKNKRLLQQNSVKNTEIRNQAKDLARILTILRERELQQI